MIPFGSDTQSADVRCTTQRPVHSTVTACPADRFQPVSCQPREASSSSSAAASAVAAVKSSAKSNKQRMNLYLPPEHRAVCHGESLNQDWRTGTLLIRLNLDIHKCWNVIMPYSEEFHWGAIPFCEVLFSRQF